MKRMPSALLFLASVLAIVPSAKVLAQASLVAENMLTGLTVKRMMPDGSEQDDVFTVVRDARLAEQWYYFPNRPRLTENVIEGARVPELSLLRFTSPADDSLAAGALLTFAVTLGAEPAALEQLKHKIASELGLNGDAAAGIRLAPVPINSASAAVYSPTTGNILAQADANSIIVPTDGNGRIVFALQMNDIGSDVYQSLLAGTSGLPVWIKYNFNGLTPPAGFRVTANWDQAYSYYSKDEKFRARASYFGWFSASYSEDRTKIRDELIQNGVIKVDAITGSNFTPETLDSYLQPIVKRLNDQLLEQLQPPSKIDPAQANSPDASGFFGGVGYSVAVKDIKLVKKGSEVWDFSFSSIVERAGAANGLVSVVGYAEDVRKMVVQSIDAGSWDRVYFTMPNVPGGVDRVSLRVRLTGSGAQFPDRFLVWKEQTGWVNAQGNKPTNGIWVSLLAHPGIDKTTLAWDTSYDFALGNYAVQAKAKIPLEGDAPMSAPADLIRVVRVSADGLALDESVAGKMLVSVDVGLSDGSRTAKKSFRKETIQGSKQVTPDFLWPVAATSAGSATKISAEVSFNYADTSKCRVSFDADTFSENFTADEMLLRLVPQNQCAQ